MTTLAWRDGVLASDRQATHDGSPEKCTKLFRVNGHAVGFAGSLAYGIAFRDWFAGDQKSECPLDNDTYAMSMNLETGKCEVWEAPGVGVPVEDEWTAIGSGTAYAKAAMMMGASAKEAVQVAMKLDIHSGIGVTTIKAKNAG